MTTLERSPQALPLPCYGTEHDPADPRCVQCPHFDVCGEVGGPGQKSWDKVDFSLSTDALPTSREPTCEDVPSVYALAFSRVFSKPSKYAPVLKACEYVLTSSRQLDVSPELYIYACMLGHKISCPERGFMPAYLTGSSALSRVKFFRDRAANMFGTGDVESVGRIVGQADTLVETLRLSEELFGGWIVGERSRRGGNGVMALYANRETALSPYWLAIEPTYAKWLESATPSTAQIISHRKAVAAVPAASKRELLRLRGDALRGAAPRVLQRYDTTVARFKFGSPVISAFKFWLSLGDALLQRRLLRALTDGVLGER